MAKVLSDEEKAQMMEDMDGAADEARKTLQKIDPKAVALVRAWWQDNYMKAGHKRLGRVLLGR